MPAWFTSRCFSSLRRLHLERTGVGDVGLSHLKGLANLEYLNLYGTKVSDKGLAHLTGLKKLKRLYLWQSKVTEKGADKLRKALPDLNVNTGADLDTIVASGPPVKLVDLKWVSGHHRYTASLGKWRQYLD